MVVRRFKLKSFEDQVPRQIYTIEIPTGSSLLKCIPLPDGIYVFYAVPEVEAILETVRFTILGTKESIPEGSEFIALVDVVGHSKDDKGELVEMVMIFPVFKLGVIIPTNVMPTSKGKTLLGKKH